MYQNHWENKIINSGTLFKSTKIETHLTEAIKGLYSGKPLVVSLNKSHLLYKVLAAYKRLQINF